MPRTLKAVRKTHVPLAFLRVKSFDRDDYRLTGLESLQDSGGKQLVRPLLKPAAAPSCGQQRTDPRKRQNRGALLDDPFREPDGLRSRGADHDDQAPRRVANPISRSKDLTANGDVHWAWRRTITAWALR